MSKVIAVAAKDFWSWANAFSFYLLAAFFLGMTGYFFWSGLSYFSLVSFQAATNPAMQVKSLNLNDGVFSLFMANMTVLLLLLIPILTMKSFAEERKFGTLELLLTYPISDFEIVAGKFLGLFTTTAILILPTISYFFLASIVGVKFELASLLTGYLGLLLISASFISFGMFMSSLTEHQVISAGICFAILLFFWIIGWVADWTNPALSAIFKELSLVLHYEDMTRGILDTKDIAYFILFTSFFLFAALATLEIRSWKR